jgi:exopolysaccharide biosynthesis polyprenyl glycosylphosphotransferase
LSRRIAPLSILLFIVDLSLVPVGLLLATRLRTLLPFGQGGALADVDVRVPLLVYALALFCWGTGLVVSGAYHPQRSLRWFNEGWRVLFGAALATAVMAGFLFLTYRELSRLQFLYFFAVTTGLLLTYRVALRTYYRASGKARPAGRSKVLIIGAGDLGARVARMLMNHSRWGFEPLGYLDDSPAKQSQRIEGLQVLGTSGQLKQIVERARADEVWIALPARAHERLEQVVAALERHPVRIKVVPDYFSLALVRAEAEILGGMPIIGLRDPLIEGFPRLMKRLFDMVVTLLLLVPTGPLMGAIALLIRLDSGAPSVLRQQRVGENGRLFSMYKFRTMRSNAGEERPAADGEVLHKRRDDPRVTKAGRLLRRYSLDELPQLLNVLKGEMSLVGPRPEMPWLVDRYESWQRKRFAVPQGLTGWWQINGRSDRPMHLHTEDDLYYVYNYSIWLDIRILLQTPLAILRGQGAF